MTGDEFDRNLEDIIAAFANRNHEGAKQVAKLVAPIRLDMYVVWIDCDNGRSSEPDWEQNSPPQSLRLALAEAASCRQRGWPVCICPERETPRRDGMWTNPNT